METGFVHLHSGLRWIIVVLMLLTIAVSFSALRGNKPFSQVKKLAMPTMIFLHVQFLVGMALYFMKGWAGKWGDPEMMSTPVLRFFTMEHILLMLIAIVLATMGYSGAKRKNDDQAANRRIFRFYLVAFILILASIPWPFRSGFEAYGWF